MKTEVSKKDLFETIPVPKALMTLAIPTIISQLINLIYNVVDAFFIGRTGNSYMMAATTLTLTIFLMTVAFANLFGVGGGSLIARLIGSGRPEEAKRVSAFSIYGAIAVALLYSALIGAFLDPVLNMLGASDATIGFARQYTILVIVIGSLPTILSATLAHLLRNVGYAKQASFGLSSGGVLNIVLDPLFMFVLFPEGYEVFGAALATLLSNVFACGYLLYAFGKASKTASLSMSMSAARQISRESIKNLFSVGIPSAILTGLFDLANICVNMLSAAHSDLVLAGMGIVMKVERVPNAINIGICQGMLPIVAYNYSSGNHDRMKKTINTARTYGLIISAVSILLLEIFASPVTRLFLNTSSGDAEAALLTIGFAAVFLRIRCLASPVQFINYHTSYCMQAMGNGRGTMLHAFVRELVFYIPFMFILDHFFGENGLASALVVGEACGAMFALWMLKRAIRRQTK
ncbi:MAG: MATE family efflux transporter [Lachnospiraceae bacterium]|nr:MATE family efflux transporter [Lachnospiraceae bacterium]